jgi:4-oxalocrotonate tautomerase
MPLIQVKLIEGVFDAAEKEEIIEKLTDAMVSVEGEAMRPVTWVTLEEVTSGEWGHRRQAAAHWRRRRHARRCAVATRGLCRRRVALSQPAFDTLEELGRHLAHELLAVPVLAPGGDLVVLEFDRAHDA